MTTEPRNNPQFPLYIVSRGRADTSFTAKALLAMSVPFHIVVEADEYHTYAGALGRSDLLLVLDPAYKKAYNACMDLQPGQSPGSGPARNFAWEHSIAGGHLWHWVMDDNIRHFYRLNQNRKTLAGDGTIFRVMEDFCLRYETVAMAGPAYEMFAPRKEVRRPMVLNTRIYSCNLIRNDVPFRWRCRYNEDTDLSLRMLKAGWCTVQFYAFLQQKITTQALRGGNTDAFYAAEGTLPKSKMLVDLHPDVARLVWRYGRWHHQVDYRPFHFNQLVRRPGVEVAEGVDEYGLHRIKSPVQGR